tara:strand:+ start:6759 stop:7262 length:504 start_codon:yes stop_codon:yes gene_type:complete
MIKTCGTASSLFADATLALRTLPSRRDGLEALFLFAVFAVFAILMRAGSGPITFSWTSDWTGFLMTALAAMVIPALGEEMVFRVLLAGRAGFVRGALALFAFVLWHPLQVWIGLPFAQPVFLDPAFLATAAALGLACTISWRRSGSLWPAVAMHWAVVVVWKGMAGG